MIWISAAEASGDRLGAALVEALRARGIERFFGVPGPEMRAAGVEAVATAEEVSALGLVEAAQALPRIVPALRRAAAAIGKARVAVGVDAPGLHRRLGGAARAAGVPFVQWVAPQVWAWRAGRAGRVSAWADELLCLFPWEPLYFRPHGVRVQWTGHPAARPEPGSWPRHPSPTVLLAPGSRPQEIARHTPILTAVAARVRARWPDARLVVPVAPTVDAAALTLPGIRVAGLRAAAREADLAVVASGTATLELAAAGVPQVIVYQVHPATWQLGRRLLHVEAIGLPNLLAPGSVPEHVQHLDPDRIFGDLAALWAGEGHTQRARLAAALDGLGADGAIERVADAVLARW